MTRGVPALLAGVLFLAGCGEREEPTGADALAPVQPLEVMLDFPPSPEHAGLFAAQEGGTFEDARLDVELIEPPEPSAPLEALEAGEVDVAISYEPELLLARDRGADLVSIGALVQVPLTSIVSSGEDAVGRTGQLRGRRVATAGLAYQEAVLRAILQQKGVRPADVELDDVGFDLLDATVSDRFVAVFGATWNDEAVELDLADRQPTALRVGRLGVPTYAELVFVVRAQDARERGALLRGFMQAVARGHRMVREDPDAGAAVLLRENRDLDRAATRASVRATLPLFFPGREDAPEGEQRPFGFQELEEWDAFGRWMLANGLVRLPPDARAAATNEFLPGEGIAVDEGAP
ncbi:MAG TPA: ABC transporter substrate-binding protein [Solirubrobacteraceae bacterium]|nr:ABC transporter substrate-binding protein [Solirubrobacteraceae bacterium]